VASNDARRAGWNLITSANPLEWRNFGAEPQGTPQSATRAPASSPASSSGRGHFQTFGTAVQVADMMEEWVTTGAAFVATVIPELQRRGLYRTRYEATTLRGNLGLPYLESRYARMPAATVATA
jgi:alkanesulfonate monooxygenase SsuD/methylene tetrahydromethanopterin reductase-like flavin-dependent oxidoreductase (luciferase family)